MLRNRTKDSAAQGRHVRLLVRPAEFRAADGDAPAAIEGLGVVYDTWTRIGSGKWGYEERVAPGAFARSLGKDGNEGRDILSRMDHRDYLGRTRNGTLVVTDTEDGIRFRVTPNPGTTAGADALAMAARGDFGGASMEFKVDGYELDESGDVDRLTITSGRLYELGPVSEPAYQTTTAELRALRDAAVAARRTREEDEKWEWRLREHQLLRHKMALKGVTP